MTETRHRVYFVGFVGAPEEATDEETINNVRRLLRPEYNMATVLLKEEGVDYREELLPNPRTRSGSPGVPGLVPHRLMIDPSAAPQLEEIRNAGLGSDPVLAKVDEVSNLLDRIAALSDETAELIRSMEPNERVALTQRSGVLSQQAFADAAVESLLTNLDKIG